MAIERVRVGKSEVQLHKAKHTMKENRNERTWKNIKPVLERIKNVDGIAFEGTTSPKDRKQIKENIKKGKKINGPKESEIKQKCLKERINLLLVDSELKENLTEKERETDKKAYFKALNQKTDSKFFEEIKHAFTPGKYRDIIMTDNIIKSIAHQEKDKKRLVTIAVVAEPHHIKQIRKYLKNPGEFKKLKKTVKKMMNNRFERAKWSDLTVIKPEHLEEE